MFFITVRERGYMTIMKLSRFLTSAMNFTYAFFTETLFFFVMTACYGINLEKSNPSKIKDSQIPILFIHGLYHNSSAWIRFFKIFKKANYEALFTINLGNPWGSIDEHALKVKKMVHQIQQITGRREIILIGHSMGGIVASKFALDFVDQGTEVKAIVTIGSPLKGAPLANYIGFGKSVKEMRSGSNFIKNLESKIYDNSVISFFHIAARPDLMVPLKSALFLENKPARHLMIPNLGHLGLLYSKSVIGPILQFLTQLHKN